MAATCTECARALLNADKTTCSARCRQRRKRRLDAEAADAFRAEAAALLLRSTRAAIAQDAGALAAVDRDAARLFGPAYAERLTAGL